MHRVSRLICSLIFSVAVVCAASDAPMRVSKPEVRDEIVAVIEAQLAAFRGGDTAKAYSYASDGLRVQTALPEFASMVRKNYPEIWLSTRAEFAIVRDDGSRAMLAVHVVGKKSDATYDYVLFKEPAGWRIGGVLRHESRKADAV